MFLPSPASSFLFFFFLINYFLLSSAAWTFKKVPYLLTKPQLLEVAKGEQT